MRLPESIKQRAAEAREIIHVLQTRPVHVVAEMAERLDALAKPSATLNAISYAETVLGVPDTTPAGAVAILRSHADTVEKTPPAAGDFGAVLAAYQNARRPHYAATLRMIADVIEREEARS